MKLEQTQIKIEKVIVTWTLGYLPECSCFLSKISLLACPHIRFISKRRDVGDKNFLFKSEGGNL